MKSKLIVITGGLGFIGKHMVQKCLAEGHFVTNVDVVNYAADRYANEKFNAHPNYRHLSQDIATLDHLPECDLLMNFAAESHVDNSIADSKKFCRSNIMGMQHLLELTRSKHASGAPVFIQISTDEVYGDIRNGRHKESDPLCPSNPYSSTKAAADMLLLGWSRTYDLRYSIIRLTNNYGFNQYPEKLIPKSALRMRRGLPALIQGDGSYVRSWLHVEDSIDAIFTIIEKGEHNQIYNVQGRDEFKNIEVVRKLAAILEVPEEEAFINIPNRVGQDVRYSLDDSKIKSLEWKPRKNFDEELKKIAFEDDFKRFL